MGKILYKNKEKETVLLEDINILRNTGFKDERFLEIQLFNETLDGNRVLYIKGLTREQIDEIILNYFNNDCANLMEYDIEALFLTDTYFFDDEDFDEELLDEDFTECIDDDDEEYDEPIDYELDSRKNWFFGKK